jgi:hypothetical protein
VDVDIDVDESFRDPDSAGMGGELLGGEDGLVELHSAAEDEESEDVGDDQSVTVETVRRSYIGRGASGVSG